MRGAPRRWLAVRPTTVLGWLAAAAGLYVFAGLFRTPDLIEQFRALPLALLACFPLMGLPALLGTLSWARAFPAAPDSRVPGLGRLYWLRLAGESINNGLASAYVAGEPVKGLLAARYGASTTCGLASGVIGKTTLTLGEVLYLFLALGVAARVLGTDDPLVAGLLGASGLGLVLVVLAIQLQRRRIVGRGARLLLGLRLGSRRIWTRALPGADAIDAAISGYYAGQRRDLAISIAWGAGGWLAGALELWLFLTLATPAENPLALAIVLEAAILITKGLGLFVPGSLGVQEGGIVWLFVALGLGKPAGVTYAVLRRSREVLWILLGFALLASHLRRSAKAGEDDATSEEDPAAPVSPARMLRP